jgi:hypothetical protein
MRFACVVLNRNGRQQMTRIEQAAASRNRAEYRTVGGAILLQEYRPR